METLKELLEKSGTDYEFISHEVEIKWNHYILEEL